MRKLLLTLPFLFACPGDSTKKGDEVADTKAEEKGQEKGEPEKPEPAVWVFGLKAETAMYKKGKDGARDRLEFGGVGDQVSSPDGKQSAEILKIVESNLFFEQGPKPEGVKGDVKYAAGEAPHAWLIWLDDRQAEIALYNPIYSAGARTLTVEVEVVGGPLNEGSLGPVELRVQDCPDQDYQCAKFQLEACQATTGKIGTCWNWLALNCLPCHCSEDMELCKEHDPKCCGDPDAPCYPSKLGPNGWERFCL